jgi:hypothetical protein
MMKEVNYPTLNRNASVVSTKASVGITPFDIKMQLMKGSSNILGKVHMNDPVTSSYQHIYKGLQTRYINKPIDLDICQSCSTGVVIPDPILLKSIRSKETMFRESLRQSQSMKNFE